MKPYEPNWPHGYVTRDGRPVKILTTERKHDRYPIIALVPLSNQITYEVMLSFSPNGKFVCEDLSCDEDIFCVEPETAETENYIRLPEAALEAELATAYATGWGAAHAGITPTPRAYATVMLAELKARRC